MIFIHFQAWFKPDQDGTQSIENASPFYTEWCSWEPPCSSNSSKMRKLMVCENEDFQDFKNFKNWEFKSIGRIGFGRIGTLVKLLNPAGTVVTTIVASLTASQALQVRHCRSGTARSFQLDSACSDRSSWMQRMTSVPAGQSHTPQKVCIGHFFVSLFIIIFIVFMRSDARILAQRPKRAP